MNEAGPKEKAMNPLQRRAVIHAEYDISVLVVK
jgi:hypothetical protein